MDSILKQAMRDSRSRSDSLLTRAGQSLSGMGPMGMLSSSTYGGMDALGRGAQNMAQHAEQLAHFTGYTFAIIRTIANRIAGQPLRIARRGQVADTGRVVGRESPHQPQAWVGVQKPNAPQQPILKPQSQGWRQNYSAANLWKRKVPLAVRSLLDQSDAEPIDDHAILRLFETPNPIMSRSTAIFNTVACLEITGKANWWLDQDESGYWRIWPLPPSWTEPIHEEGKPFAEWKINAPGLGEPIVIPGERMIYFYYPDPSNPLGACSPLQALARTVLVDEYIEEAQRRAFINGINPGLALIVGRLPEVSGVGGGAAEQPVLTKEQRNQLINSVKAIYRGVMNHDEPLILDGLIKDAKKINQTVREMDFTQSQQSVRGRLCQGWGVSPISMGETGSNRAESAVADDHLAQNVLNPRISLISEVLTARLAPLLAPGEDLVLYLEDCRSIDVDHDLQVNNALFQSGCLTINERRAAEGLPPLVGGDCINMGGKLIPAYIDDGSAPEGASLIEETATPPQQPTIPGPETPPDESGGPEVTPTPLPPQGASLSDLSVKEGHPSSPSFNPSSSSLHPTHEKVIRGWLVQQARAETALKDAIAHYFVYMGDDVCKTLAERRSQKDASPDDDHEDILSEHLDPAKWADGLRAACRLPLVRASYAGAVLEWMAAKGFKKGSPPLPVEYERHVQKEIEKILNLDYWQGIIGTARDTANRSVVGLRSQGVTGHELLTKAVRASLGEGPASLKAADVASTEASAAINAGAHFVRGALGRQGKIKKKCWWSMQDEKVRDIHARAHGQIVGYDEPFQVGGEACQYPGDPILTPANRCGCRCGILTIPGD